MYNVGRPSTVVLLILLLSTSTTFSLHSLSGYHVDEQRVRNDWNLSPPLSLFMQVIHGRYLGVTPPIATTESNEREKEVTVTLMEELKKQKTVETPEESRTR